MLKQPSNSKALRLARELFEDQDRCAQVLDMFSLCANAVRFKILCLLDVSDLCVSEIVTALNAKYSNISQQLKILTLAGYLDKYRVKKSIFYRLKDRRIKEILVFLREKFRES
jgi:DNA-binding transcriptional ArsR family regulator